jgi:hypothetical protein
MKIAKILLSAVLIYSIGYQGTLYSKYDSNLFDSNPSNANRDRKKHLLKQLDEDERQVYIQDHEDLIRAVKKSKSFDALLKVLNSDGDDLYEEYYQDILPKKINLSRDDTRQLQEIISRFEDAKDEIESNRKKYNSRYKRLSPDQRRDALEQYFSEPKNELIKGLEDFRDFMKKQIVK